MADIRIKDLVTTASSAASDDFLAVDGFTNGTRKMSAANPSVTTLTTSGVIAPGGSVHGANGSAGNPSFAFNSDQNTGLYRIGAGNIGVTANGSKVLDIATTGLTVTGALGASSLTSPADLTLAGGSTGASLVLQEGGAGTAKISRALKLGTTTFTTFSPSTGEVLIQNGTVDSPGVHFYTANATNFAIDATNSLGLRFVTDLDEDTGSIKAVLTRTGNLLIGTTDATGLTGAGGLKIASSTAGSSGAGALVVTGGLATGAASYIGGALTVSAGATFTGDVVNSASTGTYYGGTSTGGGGFANSNASAYMLAYGPSNATFPSQLQFNSNGSVALRINGTAATFAGVVAIGNTVAVGAAVASTHKVTMVIGGVTYYLLASNV